ncbi:hypothetical protein ACKWTF_010368 [Chironomus riparius]
MIVRKIFCGLTNCLGLCFHDIKVSLISIFVVQILINIFNILAIFYVPFYKSKRSWYRRHGIYSVIEIYQSIFPYIIQTFLIAKSYLMRNQQKFLSEKLKPKFTQKIGKCEKNFLIRVLVIILIRITKFIWGRSKTSIIFNSHTTFPELIYSSNDLMFVYYVELLIEYLEYINYKIQMMRTKNDMKIIKREIYEVFVLKRKILERYSMDIFITISFHFLVLIISFYWVIMRLLFNLLKRFDDFATFLYFIEPIFIYWIMFSKCEEFYSKVISKLILNLVSNSHLIFFSLSSWN